MTLAVGRLESSEGEQLGTAFAIAAEWALTAFHCVGDRLMRTVTHSEAKLEFAGGTSIGTRVELDDPQDDYALLHLDRPVPPELDLVELTDRVRAFAEVRAVGAVASVAELRTPAVLGQVAEPAAELLGVPVIQLTVLQAGADLPLQGLSGGPVLTGAPERAAGIVRWNPLRDDAPALARGDIVVACPMRTVLERIRQRTGVRARSAIDDRLEVLLERHPFFAGRADDLERLDSAVFDRASGYVFVTGPSGCGKSTFLRQWSRGLADRARPPDVVHVSISRLEGRADQDLVLRDLADQLASVSESHAAASPGVTDLSGAVLRALQGRAPAGRSLVVVIDGLDEADEWITHSLLLPPAPSEGVYGIFGARHLPGRQWHQDLHLDDTAVACVRLEGIGRDAVSELLVQAGGLATRWAADDTVLSRMLAITRGDSFHLRHLAEDLRDGRIQGADELDGRSAGLNHYFDGWWKELRGAVLERPGRNLLGYLSVSHGPLRRDDLTDVSDADALDGFTFDAVFERLARHLSGDPDTGLAIAHPRFQEYVLARHVRAAEQRPYRERLTAWCARWLEHRSPYALRFFSRHLVDEGDLDRLTALAMDDAFRDAQQQELPGEPGLSLRVTREALALAGACGDTRLFATLLLRHGLVAESRSNPVALLDEVGLEAAWAAVELESPDLAWQAYVWLAFHLGRRGQLEEARATLNHIDHATMRAADFLQERNVIGTFARFLGEHPWAAELVRPMLTESVADRMPKALREAGALDAAVATVDWIPSAKDRDEEIARLGGALAEAGNGDAAIQLAARGSIWARTEIVSAAVHSLVAAGDVAGARAAVAALPADDWRGVPLLHLAYALAEHGDATAAEEIARGFRDLYDRAVITAAAARARVRDGDLAEAKRRLREVLDEAVGKGELRVIEGIAITAQRCEMDDLLTDALAEARVLVPWDDSVARAVADERRAVEEQAAGARDPRSSEAVIDSEAKHNVSMPSQTALRDDELDRAFADIAVIQAWWGLYEEASGTAERIGSPETWQEALAGIASARAEHGDVDEALQLIRHGPSQTARPAQLSIAESLARLGRLDEARALLEPADAEERKTSLQMLAWAVLKTGDFDTAEELLDESGPSTETLCRLAVERHLAGLPGVAEALAEASTLAKDDPKELREVAAALIRCGERERGLALLQDLLRRSPNPTGPDDGLVSIDRLELCRAALAAGELELAASIAQRMLQPRTRTTALAELAAAQAQAGLSDTARETFAAAQATLLAASHRHHPFLLSYLAARQARSGLYDEAIATAESTPANHAAALANLATTLADEEGAEEACLRMLPQIATTPSHALHACTILARALPAEAAAVVAAIRAYAHQVARPKAGRAGVTRAA